jgi:DNA-binding GntR family transcriptional regulator
LKPLAAKPESLTQIVFDTIRDAIVSKLLSPGHRVSEVGLARQLQVSKTPVREALLRLPASAWIRHHRHRRPGRYRAGGYVSWLPAGRGKVPDVRPAT